MRHVCTGRGRSLLAAVAACAAVFAAAALAAGAPPGATALCRDGTYSSSQHRSGTCSHHRGVARWLGGAASPPPAAPAAARTVLVAARTRVSGCRDGAVPDRSCSPGAYDARVTPANIRSTICVAGYTRRVRNVPQSEKDAVYLEYGIRRHRPGAYEIDHIVALELGGSNDIANLYPESYAIADGARTKDRLENRLHELVCTGRISLRTAQRQLATNWLAALHRLRLG